MLKTNLLKSGVCMLIACVLSVSALSMAGCGNKSNADTENTISTEEEIILTLTQDSGYPECYKDEIKSVVKTATDKMTGESVSYVFITDLHLDNENDPEIKEAAYRQLNAVVDVANNANVDFVCVGGDLYDGRCAQEAGGKKAAMDTIESVTKVLEKCNMPVFMLKGNHDDNSFSAQVDESLLYSPEYIISNDEWYQVTMGHFSQYAQSYHNGYFYYDLPNKNTRVICLNMSDSDDGITDGLRNEMGMYFYGYKDAQIEWLLNDAMSRQDCQYMFMCHDQFMYGQGYADDSNRDVLRGIVAAAYTHQKYDDGKFSKDFTNWTGKPILYNCGHMHMSGSRLDPETGNMPILNTELSRYFPNRKSNSRYSEMGFGVAEGRQFNTVSEALFDLVVSNPTKIDIIRFGAGADRVLNITK